MPAPRPQVEEPPLPPLVPESVDYGGAQPMTLDQLEAGVQTMNGYSDVPMGDESIAEVDPVEVTLPQTGMRFDWNSIAIKSKEEFDALPPERKELLRAIKNGVQFTDKSAAEFILAQQVESMKAAQNAQPPRIVSVTNQATGGVMEFLTHPSMQPQPIKRETFQTQGGIYSQMNPTNAVPIVDPATGKPLMGYAAEPTYGDAGAALGASAAPAQAPQSQFKEGSLLRQNGQLFRVVGGVPTPVQQ